MGNNSLLIVSDHIAKLICSIDKIEDSEHLHTLVHSLETVVQCQQSAMVAEIYNKRDLDFPTSLDLD
jgi:uncharacterized protein with ACT and thioredoxin-like domain